MDNSETEEYIKRIFVGCTTLVPSEYTNRHNKIAGYIHRTLCKLVGLQVTEGYYEHVSEKAINVNGTTIMCDVPVVTDRTN
jgi:hypothetical protein